MVITKYFCNRNTSMNPIKLNTSCLSKHLIKPRCHIRLHYLLVYCCKVLNRPLFSMVSSKLLQQCRRVFNWTSETWCGNRPFFYSTSFGGTGQRSIDVTTGCDERQVFFWNRKTIANFELFFNLEFATTITVIWSVN